VIPSRVTIEGRLTALQHRLGIRLVRRKFDGHRTMTIVRSEQTSAKLQNVTEVTSRLCDLWTFSSHKVIVVSCRVCRDQFTSPNTLENTWYTAAGQRVQQVEYGWQQPQMKCYSANLNSSSMKTLHERTVYFKLSIDNAATQTDSCMKIRWSMKPAT
jgi:hypothetical protein